MPESWLNFFVQKMTDVGIPDLKSAIILPENFKLLATTYISKYFTVWVKDLLDDKSLPVFSALHPESKEFVPLFTHCCSPPPSLKRKWGTY